MVIIVTTIISGVMGIAGTILGVLIGGRMSNRTAQKTIETTHKNAIELLQRQDFNQNVKEFRSAFQDELAMLSLESTSTYDIIKPARIKHRVAYSIFRGYLTGQELENFISAWRIYYVSTPPCPDNEDDQKYQNERTAIIERIEALLDFAKFK